MVNFLSSTATFHVADLDLVNDLLKPGTYRPNNIATRIFPNVRKLHITARLSLSACKKMEGECDVEADSNKTKASVELWNSIWPAMAQLTKLRMLKIEIDHTTPVSWSVVNEHAIAYPIVYLAAIAPKITVVIAFPILHPFYENSTRHFMQASTTQGAKLTIRRRLRQVFLPSGKTGLYDDVVQRSCYDNYPCPPDLRKLLGEGELSPKELKWQAYDLARWRKGEDLHIEDLGTDDEACAGCGGKKLKA